MDRSREGLATAHADGATPLTDDEMEGLLVPSIGTRSELNAAEQQNVTLGSLWLSGRRNRTRFDEALVWDLHARMFRLVWRWAGKPRQTGKNLGVPIERIRPDVRDLIQDVMAQRAIPDVDKRMLCATFHQRLVRIHAFPNGNGRHARLMTDLLAEQLHIAVPTWGGEDLTRASETRRRYIDSLRRADMGDLSQLVEFMWTNSNAER